MAVVIDASVTVAWCIETEESAYADEVLERLGGDSAIVPPIWTFEIGNALLHAERRQRISPAETEHAIRLLRALPITVVDGSLAELLDRVFPLARGESLTVYDASYLELAMRRGLALATQDNRLRAAATNLGVPLL